MSSRRIPKPHIAILEPTEDGDIEALARILAAIAIRIAREEAERDQSGDLPAREQQRAGRERRVA